MGHASDYQSCRFEIPERSGQHSLGDTAKTPPQLPVPMGPFAKVGQNGHGPLANINRGNRLRCWCGWNVHSSQPVLRIFLFAKIMPCKWLPNCQLSDATGFLPFAPLGTQMYLLDATTFYKESLTLTGRCT